MKNTLAIIYDFDLTLSPKYMQDYGLFQSLKTTNKDFITEVNNYAKENNADSMLSFMLHILTQAKKAKVKITKKFLQKMGKNISYYEGVEEWFDRINEFGKKYDVQVEHYIISAGCKELLKGCTIFNKFKRVYACEFAYDENGTPYWPKIVVNYTTKTQFLFRIRKNMLDALYDDKNINDKLEDDKQLPFNNIVYLGDGDTDIPCMQIVTNAGGLSLSVYDENNEPKKTFAKKLLTSNRVSGFVEADYTENSQIDILIKKKILDISKENLKN